MIDPRVQLLLLITDKIFTLVQHAQTVSKMNEVEVLTELGKERLLKDSLVEEVTLP